MDDNILLPGAELTPLEIEIMETTGCSLEKAKKVAASRSRPNDKFTNPELGVRMAGCDSASIEALSIRSKPLVMSVFAWEDISNPKY